MKKYLFSAAAVALGAVAVVTSAWAGEKPPKPQNDPHKVYVCKYVGTPGAGEVLQTGQNPIEVDSHALEGGGFSGAFPFEFSDAHGRSVAIGWSGKGYPELGLESCLGPDTGTPDCNGDHDPENNGSNGDCTVDPDPNPDPRPRPRRSPGSTGSLGACGREACWRGVGLEPGRRSGRHQHHHEQRRRFAVHAVGHAG